MNQEGFVKAALIWADIIAACFGNVTMTYNKSMKAVEYTQTLQGDSVSYHIGWELLNTAPMDNCAYFARKAIEGLHHQMIKDYQRKGG